MNKKIIFFDGDGTLWYPYATRRTAKPHWVYEDESTKDDYLKHLCLTPTAAETLLKLREHGIVTVILSVIPYEPDEAARILGEKVDHFKLGDLFDEVRATPERPEAKGEIILEVVKRLGFIKEDALMVGDSYRWDYLSATNKGIDAVLIDSDSHQERLDTEPVEYLISELDDLTGLLGL